MRRKLVLISVAAIAALSFVSCRKDCPSSLPQRQVLSFSSVFDVYSHGSQGWMKTDTVGIFSISGQQASQNNLAYLPTGTATYEIKDLKGKKYIMYNSQVTGEIELKPLFKDKSIVFNEGENIIYAYTPFNKESSDYKKISVPDIRVQNQNPQEFKPFSKYGLYYASAKVTKYSDAPLSLGAFKPCFSQITLPGVSCPDALVGKTCTKIIVKSERPIAYEKGATIDLSTMTITGKPVRQIEYVLSEPLEIVSGYKGASIGSTSYIMVAVPFDKGLETEFEFVFTIDGKDYSMKAKAHQKMSKENNLNMYGNSGI